MKKLLILLTLSAFITTPALAQKKEAKPAKAKVKLTLKERKIVKKVEAELAEDEIKTMNKACGSKIKVTINWASFKKADAISSTIDSACSDALDQIERVCQDDLGKEAVSTTIKAVTCQYADKKNRSHELKKGVLTESIWVKSGGGEYFAQSDPKLQTWLGDNL